MVALVEVEMRFSEVDMQSLVSKIAKSKSKSLDECIDFWHCADESSDGRRTECLSKNRDNMMASQ